MTTENMEQAAAAQANAEKERADAEAEQAKAAAAENTATAAQTATAAAEAAAALATAEAAKTIIKDEGDKEWLRQHATQTDTSLKEMKEQLSSLSTAIPALIASSQESLLATLAERLTPQQSTGSGTVNAQKESADADAQREAEKAKKKKLQQRHWI